MTKVIANTVTAINAAALAEALAMVDRRAGVDAEAFLGWPDRARAPPRCSS